MRYFLRHSAYDANLTGGKASACLRRRHAEEFQKVSMVSLVSQLGGDKMNPHPRAAQASRIPGAMTRMMMSLSQQPMRGLESLRNLLQPPRTVDLPFFRKKLSERTLGTSGNFPGNCSHRASQYFVFSIFLSLCLSLSSHTHIHIHIYIYTHISLSPCLVDTGNAIYIYIYM